MTKRWNVYVSPREANSLCTIIMTVLLYQDSDLHIYLEMNYQQRFAQD